MVKVRARVLWRVVKTLNLSRFAAGAEAAEGRGERRVLSVRMLLTLWLYAVLAWEVRDGSRATTRSVGLWGSKRSARQAFGAAGALLRIGTPRLRGHVRVRSMCILQCRPKGPARAVQPFDIGLQRMRALGSLSDASASR